MPGNARLFDLCVGNSILGSSTGFIVTASPDRKVNGLGQARYLDVVIGSRGSIGTIATSSGDCYTNNRGVARCGDLVVGSFLGIIVTCSGDFFTD